MVGEGSILGGRWRLERELGRGGMKTVFRAVHLTRGIHAAVAVLNPEHAPRMLGREVALMQRVRHPCVARLYDAGIDRDGPPWVASELCEGGDLAALLQRRGKLPVEEAVPILLQVARGLHAIHQAHVLHRDVKPANVMLTPSGVKVIDFGLAQVVTSTLEYLHSVAPAGTLAFFAPEVMDGKIDARVDVYALGVTAFQVLTGGLPCEPITNFLQFMERLRRKEPWDLSRLPREPVALWKLVTGMLEMDRRRRPAMDRMVDALHRLTDPDAYDPEPEPERADAGAVEQVPPAPLRTELRLLPLPAAGPEVRRWLEPVGRLACDAQQVMPGDVVSTGWPFAPWVFLRREGRATWAIAFDAAGRIRWSTQLAAEVSTGLACDMDKDGVPELYLAGERALASLDAGGAVRFLRPLEPAAGPGVPTLWVHDFDGVLRLVVDGLLLDARGEGRARFPYLCSSDGERLVPCEAARGAALNGRAGQAFVGACQSAAAILRRPPASEFHVALLEADLSDPVRPAVMLAIYGPGGVQVARTEVGVYDFLTAPPGTVERLREGKASLFSPAVAPLAAARPDGGFTVVVPFLQNAPWFGPRVLAFDAFEGRELWRLEKPELPPISRGGPARPVLLDLDGDRRPELVFSHEERLWVVGLEEGEVRARLPLTGAPVAFEDPAGTGRLHLLLAGREGVDVWRGPSCLPGLRPWSGERGDLWRSGALSKEGLPIGPR